MSMRSSDTEAEVAPLQSRVYGQCPNYNQPGCGSLQIFQNKVARRDAEQIFQRIQSIYVQNFQGAYTLYCIGKYFGYILIICGFIIFASSMSTRNFSTTTGPAICLSIFGIIGILGSHTICKRKMPEFDAKLLSYTRELSKSGKYGGLQFWIVPGEIRNRNILLPKIKISHKVDLRRLHQENNASTSDVQSVSVTFAHATADEVTPPSAYVGGGGMNGTMRYAAPANTSLPVATAVSIPVPSAPRRESDPNAGAVDTGPGRIEDRLLALSAMRAAGDLTEDEFQAAKAKILAL